MTTLRVHCRRPQFYLAVLVGHISPRVQSAAVPYMRPVSEGSQSYTTKPDEYPITEPMTKLTALLQVSAREMCSTTCLAV